MFSDALTHTQIVILPLLFFCEIQDEGEIHNKCRLELDWFFAISAESRGISIVLG